MKLTKKLVFTLIITLFASVGASAQFNVGKALNSGAKAVKALTLTDAQMAQYVKEYIDWMDTHNKVTDADDPYTKRLVKLTEGLTSVDGIPLNFKVYDVIDVNAFACADGSVRVFSSLMDIMSDDELLGVIGHEIGHVALRHSKKAFKESLLMSALRDGVSSTGGTAAKLSDSQLGDLSEAIAGAKYSQKQESQADDYGYKFLKENGKNPAAMILSFKKLKEMEDKQGGASASKLQKFFSTHPDLEKRIEKMAKKCKEDGVAVPE